MDRAPGKDFMAVFQSMEPMYEIGDARCQNALIAELDDVERWLTRSQLTRGLLEALELPEPWSGRAHVVATSVLTGALGPEEAGALDRLKILISYYPRFRRLLDLQGVELRRVANTLEELRGEIQATGEVPAWLSHAETSIEAHRLSSLVRGSLGVHPDSLSEIAGALTQGQDRRRAAISEIVRRKRRLATHDAFQVPSIRTPLLALRKLLRRKRLNDSLIALRNSIDYDAVLRVFPCWIATIDDATRLFPPKSGLFDYMIVDEASQCGQATAMPLAFRAKRMIVVGDKKQLQPVSSMFLAESTVQLLQEEHGLHTHPKAHFLDGKDSLLALAEACSNASRFLDEHFRCDPAIIRWSNHRFYDDRLQILTRRRPDRALIPLEVRELKGPDEDRDDKVNREEAAAVVAAIRRLVSSGEAKHKTIGVISPFRAQAELIQLLLIREFHPDPELLKQHEIVASTADGFQGDERDIILFSFRQGPSSHAGSVTTIQRAEERLNVAFTRARQRAICFVSIPVHHFPAGAIRDFLEHAVSEQNRSTRWDVEGDRPDDFESQFEEAVCKRLRDRALRVTTQVPCGRYRIDLVVEDSEGRQLAVECDGEWKLDALGQLRPEDYQRQDIIERAGWAVHRISGRKWLLNPEREIDLTLEALGRQPTRATLDRFADSSGEPRAGPIIDPLVDDEGPGAAGAPVTRVPPPPPRPSAIAERPLSGSDEAEGEAPTDSRILLAHELIHWNILRSPPEWPVVETLQDIHGSLVRKAAITALQTELLQEAYKMARNAGFQPSPVARPEA
jgi:very-short-patch-repair endonuclease